MTRTLSLLTRLRREDRGTTLAELLVGMVVMGIFMAIFTTAVITMVRTTLQVEAVPTWAGMIWWVPLMPSWPYPFSPQHHSVPSARTAQVKA